MSERQVETVTDAQGRVIELVSLSVLDQYRLRSAIRPELRGDPTAEALATTAASVRSIGGVPVIKPQTPEQLEAIIGKLDDDGWAVLMARMERKLADAKAAMEAAVGAGEGPLAPSAE